MLYTINKSYADNFQNGPQLAFPIPERQFAHRNDWINFLGYSIASPIGVAAGPLLSSQWTNLAAQLGFDIVTYKTIRSKAHPAYPLPNIIYIETDEEGHANGNPVKQSLTAPKNQEHLAITNSFGMPSQSPEYLYRDIARANAGLLEGQILIVSITGSSDHSQINSEMNFIDDFKRTAILAKDCGAKIVEANFSCPNVSVHAGSLYLDSTMVYKLSKILVNALEKIPLIIKVGNFPDLHSMRASLIAADRAGVHAVSGINTIKKSIINDLGLPALANDRLESGVCGSAIRNTALNFVRDARKLIDEEILQLTLIGVGGVTKAEHFQSLLNAGANIVQSATGMMWNPLLANDYHQLYTPYPAIQEV